jgi:hypothetical protein
MKVLVTGGRDYSDATRVGYELAKLLSQYPSLEIAQGAARGADTLAALWCERYEVPQKFFPANWTLHGRSAGAIRNRVMLKEFQPDLVLAFPGGRGTADMVKIAKKAGVKVVEVIGDIECTE